MRSGAEVRGAGRRRRRRPGALRSPPARRDRPGAADRAGPPPSRRCAGCWTGYADEPEVAAAEAAGVLDACVAKPIDGEGLGAALDAARARRR
ncbi:MAG: hypothetical protein R2939_15615 [Kofleriaceae bacterium]